MSPKTNTHNLAELRNILRILWSDPTLPAALLIGPPGCGKSTLVSDLAREMGMPCEIMMANIREPSDFAGLPVVAGDEVHMLPLEWARRIAGTKAVLFLDEINTARPATIAALLRVVLDRVVGEVKLGPEVRIIAAMNVAEEAAHGWELPPALANRFYHFTVAPTPVEHFRAWALEQSDSPELTELIKGFVAESMHDTAACGPFASPRSWFAAFRAAAHAIKLGRPELAQSLVASSVGVGNAMAWATNFDAKAIDWDQPQPAAIVKKALLQMVNAVRDGRAEAPELWALIGFAGINNIAATFTTLGTEHSYLQKIATTPEAMRILEKIYDRAQEVGI